MDTGIHIGATILSLWLQAAVASITLKPGMTLHISLTTILLRPDERSQLINILKNFTHLHNATLHLQTHAMSFSESGHGMHLEHNYISVEDI